MAENENEGQRDLPLVQGCDEATADRLARQMRFIVEADKLKSVQRQSPLMDSSRRETDSEHSWHVALIALVLAEYADPPVDAARVLKMLLIYDLVDIDAGDTSVYDDTGRKTQEAREADAADRVFGSLPNDQASDLRALGDEVETRESNDARVAGAIDRLQPTLHNYVSGGGTWLSAGESRECVVERNMLIETRPRCSGATRVS